MTIFTKMTAMLCGIMFLFISGGVFADNGTVKWFNALKKFGLITPEGGGADILVNLSDTGNTSITTLTDGQKVTFSIDYSGGKGAHAINVKPVVDQPVVE